MDLFVREAGPAGAPTIVFLHAGGISGWMWEPQLAGLQRDYHCLAPDLPEHGRSAQAGPYTMPGAAEQVVQLIRERAHGGRAHVVGLSLGAQLTVQILSRAPEVVDHAVASSALVIKLPGRSLMPLTIRLSMPLLRWSALLRWAGRTMGVPAPYMPHFVSETQRLSYETLVRIYRENLGMGLPPGLERAQAPVLAVCGGRERVLMPRSVCRLASALPHARACVAPRLGHTWNLEDPALFNATVRAWISDQPLPAALQQLPC